MTTRLSSRPLAGTSLALLLFASMFSACATPSGDISWWQWVNARRSAKAHILSMTTATAIKPTPEVDQDLEDLFRERVDLERQVRIAIRDGAKAWEDDDQRTLRQVVKELEDWERKCSNLVQRIRDYEPAQTPSKGQEKG